MPRVVVHRGSHTRIENGKAVTYKRGGTFDASEREYRAFKDKLGLVGEEVESLTSDVTDGTGGGSGGGNNDGDDERKEELRAVADLARETEDLKQLRELAFATNVDVSNRWGVDRTRQAILEAIAKELGESVEGQDQSQD